MKHKQEAMEYFFITAVISVHVSGILSDQNMCRGTLPKEVAVKCCKESGKQGLHASETLPDNYNLLAYYQNISQSIFNHLWLKYERAHFQQWTWMDGDHHQSAIKNEAEGFTCATHESTEYAFAAGKCSSKNFGYICMLQNCAMCETIDRTGKQCVKVQDTCFIFYCERSNWFNAAAACRSLGTVLARVNGSFIKTPVQCGTRFWIGLRKEDWVFDKNKYLGLHGKSFWADNEPATVGNCSVFVSNKNDMEWIAEDCTKRHNFVCDNRTSFVKEIYSETASWTHVLDSPIREGSQSTWFWVLCTTIPLLILGILGATAYWCKRRNKASTRKKDPENVPLTTESEEHAIQILKYDSESKTFEVDKEGLKRVLLSPKANEKGSPLVIVSIAGPYRTGKSFLMNYILRYLKAKESGQENSWMSDKEEALSGFSWKPGHAYVTNGIWIWNRPIQIEVKKGKKFSVLLMDTQGIYDHTTSWGTSIMVILSSLLCSIQIYNIMKSIEEKNINHLEHVLVEGHKLVVNTDARFLEKPIKTFIFLVRDRPENSTSARKYMKNMFSHKNTGPEMKKKIQNIKSYVESLKCFFLPRYTKKGDENFRGELKGLSEEFIRNICKFLQFLFNKENIKGKKENGNYIYGETLLEKFLERAEYLKNRNNSTD